MKVKMQVIAVEDLVKEVLGELPNGTQQDVAVEVIKRILATLASKENYEKENVSVCEPGIQEMRNRLMSDVDDSQVGETIDFTLEEFLLGLDVIINEKLAPTPCNVARGDSYFDKPVEIKDDASLEEIIKTHSFSGIFTVDEDNVDKVFKSKHLGYLDALSEYCDIEVHFKAKDKSKPGIVMDGDGHSFKTFMSLLYDVHCENNEGNENN